MVVVVVEEFYNHCKNDLKRHARTLSGTYRRVVVLVSGTCRKEWLC